MKILIKYFAVVAFVLSTAVSNAQCFQSHSLFIDLGFGVGVYNSTTKSYLTDSIKNGKAASIMIPLSVEFALGKHLGIGVQLESNPFFTNTDSTTGVKPIAHSGELNFFINYHVFRRSIVIIMQA